MAIVLQQIEGEKLAPRVAVLSNNEKKKLKQAKEIELSSSKYRDAGLTIKGSLGGTESHKLNINASDYMMEFCGKRVGFGALSVRV